jgi:hypothetical protein
MAHWKHRSPETTFTHIDGVLALMRVSDNWSQFRQFLKKAFPPYEKTDLGFEIELRETK